MASSPTAWLILVGRVDEASSVAPSKQAQEDAITNLPRRRARRLDRQAAGGGKRLGTRMSKGGRAARPCLCCAIPKARPWRLMALCHPQDTPRHGPGLVRIKESQERSHRLGPTSYSTVSPPYLIYLAASQRWPAARPRPFRPLRRSSCPRQRLHRCDHRPLAIRNAQSPFRSSHSF